jgi:hypothetical protein
MAPKDSPQVISFDKKFEKQQTATLETLSLGTKCRRPGKTQKSIIKCHETLIRYTIIKMYFLKCLKLIILFSNIC